MCMAGGVHVLMVQVVKCDIIHYFRFLCDLLFLAGLRTQLLVDITVVCDLSIQYVEGEF